MHPLPKRSPETPAFRPVSASIALKGEVSNQKQIFDENLLPDKPAQAPSNGAQEDLNSAAIFFLGLILADAPLRAGLDLTAASHEGEVSAGALGS